MRVRSNRRLETSVRDFEPSTDAAIECCSDGSRCTTRFGGSIIGSLSLRPHPVTAQVMTFRQVPHVHLLFFRPSQLGSLRRSHPTCIASPMWKAPAEPRISAGAYIIYVCASGYSPAGVHVER